MILQELYALYNRLLAAGEELPRLGYCLQKIAFRVVITPEGKLLRIEDALTTEQRRVGKKTKEVRVMREMQIPGKAKPSGAGINPCFLCDNTAYLLGLTDEKKGAKEQARAQLCFEELRRRHLSYEQAVASPVYSAVCRFLESWNPTEGRDKLPCAEAYTGNGVFQVLGAGYAHEDARTLQWWRSEGDALWNGKSGEGVTGICLITGREEPLAQLHDPAIKGVANAQSTGAKLVSFNLRAFDSYGKEKSYNAPVSESAAFAYCNALNYLLSRSQSRLRVGDTTTIIWTDAPAQEAALNELFLMAALDPREPDEAQDAALVKRVRDAMKNLAAGRAVEDIRSEVRYFVLGLAPNAARLSVRFFRESTMGDLMERLRAHAEALKLDGAPPTAPAYISPRLILAETVRDAKEVPPVYVGPLMRAILTGAPYPEAVAIAVLRRFTADRRISHTRCAILKAWLTRRNPSLNVTPMLNTENTQPGYVLGRIFAIFQKTQEDALGKLNRSIRDAYYPSAAATPAAVFPRLFKLHNHHIAKLENPGLRIRREKEMQAAVDLLTAIPAHLSLEQQGLFALGFYQQTSSFFTPNQTNN